MAWHTARDDAMAAAMLFSHFLRAFPGGSTPNSGKAGQTSRFLMPHYEPKIST
jgi:hypothetical protein